MQTERLDTEIECSRKDLHVWIDCTLLRGGLEWRSRPGIKPHFVGPGGTDLNKVLRTKQAAINTLCKLREHSTDFLDATDRSDVQCDPVKIYLKFFCVVMSYPTEIMQIS